MGSSARRDGSAARSRLEPSARRGATPAGFRGRGTRPRSRRGSRPTASPGRDSRRAIDDIPTTVEWMRGSPVENCTAAAASSMPHSAASPCIRSMKASSSPDASVYAYFGPRVVDPARMPPPNGAALKTVMPRSVARFQRVSALRSTRVQRLWFRTASNASVRTYSSMSARLPAAMPIAPTAPSSRRRGERLDRAAGRHRLGHRERVGVVEVQQRQGVEARAARASRRTSGAPGRHRRRR